MVNAVWISVSNPRGVISKSRPIRIRFSITESGWIAIRKHVQLRQLCTNRGGRSHFVRLWLRSCSKIFESGSGWGNFSNLRTRLLLTFQLPSIKLKFTHVFTEEMTTQTPATSDGVSRHVSRPFFWSLGLGLDLEGLRSRSPRSQVSGLRSQYRRNSRSKRSVAKLSLLFCCLQDGENNLPSTPFKIYTEFNKKCACSLPMKPGLWSRKSHHPTPTPDNFDYPTPTPTPTPVRLRPSAVLVI